MSFSLDTTECPVAATPPGTDTLADSVLILLVLSVVQRLIGFVRAVLFCRWLDAAQLGLWDMAFSFLMLAAPLAVLAIPGSFGRYLEHYRQRGQLHAIVRRTALACGLLAILAFVGVLAARRWLSLLIFGSEDQTGLVALAALSLMAVIAFNFLTELFTALRNIRLVSVLQLVNSLAFAALGLGLLVGWRCDAASVLVAYGGSCVIAVAWAVGPLRRTWRAAPPVAEAAPRSAFWARVAPYAAWILLYSMLANAFVVVDRYMIVHFANVSPERALDVVGNYHSSRVVPTLLLSLAAALGVMVLPHLSHDWEAGRRDLVAARLRLFVKLLGFGLFAAGVAVLAAAPLLFGVAFRGKFPGGEAVLAWTLVYCTWFGLAIVMQNYLLCAEKARLVCVALAAGLAVSVPLNLVLLPHLGLEGAVLSTAAANALSLWLICRFNRRFGFRLDDGAKLVLVLPMLLSLGPWPSMVALVAVAAAALWGDRLLSPEEKRQIAEGIVQYEKRMRLKPRFANHTQV
jgi:polysaccharide transporter, PST family